MTINVSGPGQRRAAASAASLVVVATACTATPSREPHSALPAAPGYRLPVAPVVVTSSNEGGVRSIVRRHNYLIEFGPYSAEVDPAEGARIVAFSLDGRSVIVPREESPEAYGSTLWTSPQSDWQWPPPPELAAAAWQAEVQGSRLMLRSETNPQLNLSAEQHIWGDERTGSLVIEVSLKNHGTEPRRIAPWQNTRVRPAGLTFYASAEPAVSDAQQRLEPVDGIVWLKHDPARVTESYKLFGDGNEGWIAHVDADLVFIKVFPDVPAGKSAPKEAEIEIYVHRSGKFVEVEQQGAYEPIAPGGASHWTVQWLVRRIPAGVGAHEGNAELVRFVRELVRGLRESPRQR